MTNLDKPDFKIAGLKLSENYETLWNIIKEGNRVPAWILYKKDVDYTIWDLIEVKMDLESTKDNDYEIGCRGISYTRFKRTKESFIEDCKTLKLHFVISNQYNEMKLVCNICQSENTYITDAIHCNLCASNTEI